MEWSILCLGTLRMKPPRVFGSRKSFSFRARIDHDDEPGQAGDETPAPQPWRPLKGPNLAAIPAARNSPSAGGVYYGSPATGYRPLCSRRFTEEVAECGGLDSQHVQFDPVEMRDTAGARDEFHFRVHLPWDRVAPGAFERKDGHIAAIIIDGRKVIWEDLGRVLMTFEGGQFKLEIRDKSQEI